MSDPQAHLSRSVDELELSVRSMNILMNMGIETIGQLVSLRAVDLLEAQHGTRKVVAEIQEILSDMGLSLRSE
jgi:DNA-directed RNA polymerase subunit alpha